MNVSLILKILIGVAGYGVWAFMAWADPTLRPDFLKFNVAMAVGTIGLVLRDMQAPAAPPLNIRPMGLMADRLAPPVAPGQGGFHTLRFALLLVFCALVAVALSACTTTMASMYTGAAAQAKAGIQVFDDNTLATMHDVLCAQPYSAIQRHPEMQAGIQQLCGPLANASSLDAGQLQLLMSVVGKAQAAGLLAAPPAAASGAKP